MLEAIDNDPKILTSWQRKLYMVQISTLHSLMKDPNTSLNQRMQFAEMLAKYGDVAPKAAVAGMGSGPGFSVNIILNDPKATNTTPVIQAVEIKEAIEAPTADPTPATSAPT